MVQLTWLLYVCGQCELSNSPIVTHLFHIGHPHTQCHSHTCLVWYTYLHSDTLVHTQLNKNNRQCNSQDIGYQLIKGIESHLSDSDHPHILCHNHTRLVHYMYLHSDRLDHIQLKKTSYVMTCMQYSATHLSDTGHPHILYHCSYRCLVLYTHLHSHTLGHMQLKEETKED